MTTCPECNRRAAYMAADPEMYRGDDTRCDAHRRAPALRWRSEPPDVPGWWWYRTFSSTARPLWCPLSYCAGIDATPNAEWAGPIPEPAEEKP